VLQEISERKKTNPTKMSFSPNTVVFLGWGDKNGMGLPGNRGHKKKPKKGKKQANAQGKILKKGLAGGWLVK